MRAGVAPKAVSAIDVECGASAEAPEALSRVQENTRDRLIYAL